MNTKNNSIEFQTYIDDTEENCWKVTCHLSGMRPTYEDMMTRSGWFVEDFTISRIFLECDSGPLKGQMRFFRSLAVMPDAFRERDLTDLKNDALQFFVDDWIDCQNKASDLCGYDLAH